MLSHSRYLPYIGIVTILMNDYPKIKVIKAGSHKVVRVSDATVCYGLPTVVGIHSCSPYNCAYSELQGSVELVSFNFPDSCDASDHRKVNK